MQKLILILLFLVATASNLLGQPIKDSVKEAVIEANKPIQEILEKIDSNVKRVQDTVSQIKANESTLANSASDSLAVDSLKKHPEVLYKNSFLKKGRKPAIVYWQFYISLLLLLFVLYKGFSLAKRSSLLRDESYIDDELVRMDEKGKAFILDASGKKINIYPENKGGKSGTIPPPPYSYARAQMFWWTIIILGCYIFFYGITGYLLPLNSTAVILLGMGGVVLMAGRYIDKREIEDDKLAKGERSQDSNVSKDFFTNILSDQGGISMHRFQAVIFNLIFGLGFLFGFINAIADFKYPFLDFSEWQFALMGVSAATFLGLKAAENKSHDASPSPEQANSAEEKPKEPGTVPDSGAPQNVDDESNSSQHDR
jgi:hypothetical protein